MRSRRLALLLMVLVLALGIGAGARDRFDDWVATTELPPLDVPVGVEVLARDGSLLRAFVVRNRSIIAGIVDIMGDGIGECHLIESVICTDIEIAGSICRKTFDGIAVQSWNL